MKIKTIIITSILTAIPVFAASSNFDKFKEETAKEEKQVVCPLNEKQERRVYQWIKKNTHDFNTVQILEWSPVAKAAKGIFEKDTGSVSFKVMIRASTVGGGMTKSVIAFTMDPNGYVDSMFADADGYSAINLDPSTADMSVGRVVYENRLTYLLAR